MGGKPSKENTIVNTRKNRGGANSTMHSSAKFHRTEAGTISKFEKESTEDYTVDLESTN